MPSYPFTSALMTGASSGIGEAMAHLLGQAGVSDGAGGAPHRPARRTRRALLVVRGAHRRSQRPHADLASVEERILEHRRPRSTSSSTTPGSAPRACSTRLDPDRLHDEIALNVQALTRLSNAALRAMVPRGRGYLLNVSSVASFQPAPQAWPCTRRPRPTSPASRESLHEEVRGTGVHVTALCPGLTKTEFQSVSNSEAYASSYPGFAWLKVDDVAAAGLADVADGKALSVPGCSTRDSPSRRA